MPFGTNFPEGVFLMENIFLSDVLVGISFEKEEITSVKRKNVNWCKDNHMWGFLLRQL